MIVLWGVARFLAEEVFSFACIPRIIYISDESVFQPIEPCVAYVSEWAAISIVAVNVLLTIASVY